VVTIVLPLFVVAVIVEDTPLMTKGLREVWQATQNVGFAKGS
jgi:hypothetical protein